MRGAAILRFLRPFWIAPQSRLDFTDQSVRENVSLAAPALSSDLAARFLGPAAQSKFESARALRLAHPLRPRCGVFSPQPDRNARTLRSLRPRSTAPRSS